MASEELPDDKMIQEGYSKRPHLLWTFLLLVLIILGLFWFISIWQARIIEKKQEQSPFLQVTNREFSLFLWQNPEYMRVHRGNKLGYLPEFSSDDDVRVIPALADRYVSAPPDVLYRYHTWQRLLGHTLAPRPISSKLFYRFLLENKEWLPENWASAPEEYAELVKKLPSMEDENLEPVAALPFLPRFAFQGWRNYFLEKSEIESVRPTGEQMHAFLEKHPHYSRNFWRNLLAETDPDYLKSEGALTYFLKVGIFNYSKTTKPSS